MQLVQKGENAKRAAFMLSNVSSKVKDEALHKIAEELMNQQDKILTANEKDLKNAESNGIKPVMVDRLRLTPERIKGIAEGVLQVRALADPVGEVLSMWKRPNGLLIGKKRVPIGVIGIIFESRPNVCVDAAVLCLKSGNACILRGGSEAIFSNMALVSVMKDALKASGIDEGAIELVEDTSRETATELMRLNKYLNVLIPRGGAGLIRAVVENATVPVIETGSGNCHIYVDRAADFEMAKSIVLNAKLNRPSVCNAAESLIVHQDIAQHFVPLIVSAFMENGVEVRGCEKTVQICPDVTSATSDDWGAEYNDLIISVKISESIDEAISHINRYNTGHSETIVTNDYASSQKFLQEVDAAAVYVNASTRFTDGFEFGFGAEIGISTQKIHARGPMGLNELTTTKYIIYGNGQIRE